MEEEIINRVANSKLKVIDLEDYYPPGDRKLVDLKDWLFQELVLREKDFRAYVKEHNWSMYKDCYVAVFCSVDAIIPDWAYMLITSELEPYSKFTAIGTLDLLETLLFHQIIEDIDVTDYKDLPVIIKGCSTKPVPLNAMSLLTSKLKPHTKSIMYGEACSAVPIYKRR